MFCRQLVQSCLFALILLTTSLQAITIALISDGPSEFSSQFTQIVKHELNDLIGDEFQLQFIESQGAWTLPSVQSQIKDAYKAPQIDLVIGLGFLSSYALTQEEYLPKISFAPLILDRKLQQISPNGKKNLSYTVVGEDLSNYLTRLQELTPFHSLGLIVPKEMSSILPHLQIEVDRWRFDHKNEITIISPGASLNSFDAALIAPLPKLSTSTKETLFRAIQIPSFAWYGKEDVELGLLGSIGEGINLERAGRRIALNCQRILLGENVEDLSMTMNHFKELTLNMETAEKLEIFPSWDLLLESKQILTHGDHSFPYLPFLLAVEYGLSSNLSLSAKWKEVRSGTEEVRQARAKLNPQLNLHSLARIIDRDRALVSVGTDPQSAAAGTLEASQILYSSELYGQLRASRFAQMGRCDRFRKAQIETTFEIAKAYLNILRERTIEKIEHSNLRLSQNYLNTAKRRESAGIASASEVFRWESSLALDQTKVAKATFKTRSAQVQLNRLLSTTQSDRFSLEELSIHSPYWTNQEELFEEVIGDDVNLEHYILFSVCEGIYLSPEIAEIEKNIYAQNEILGIANRAFWSPTVSLQGELSHRYGVGGVSGRPLIRNANRTDWAAGIDLSFPLYSGGRKCADLRKARHTLSALCIEKRALEELVKQDIRTSIYEACASRIAINRSIDSAVAARKHLNLISEAYTKGTRPMIDLLDAKQQALSAELMTTNNIYDFIIDLLATQRAKGQFDFFMTEEEKKEWKQSFLNYIHP